MSDVRRLAHSYKKKTSVLQKSSFYGDDVYCLYTFILQSDLYQPESPLPDEQSYAPTLF